MSDYAELNRDKVQISCPCINDAPCIEMSYNNQITSVYRVVLPKILMPHTIYQNNRFNNLNFSFPLPTIMATAPDLRLSQRLCGLAARPVDDDRLLALLESLG
jgi:hypothetical protein